MPTELLPTPALDPELLNLTAPHLPMNMALPLTLDLGPALEKLLLRPQESMALPQLMNMELRLTLDPDLVMLLKLLENMAPLLTTHMALLPKPPALALARSPPTPTLPLPLTRTPGGVDAREELGLPGEAKLSAEVVARRTVLPRRARARATRATRLEGRAASSRGRPSSRGGPPRPPRGSSRGADVD